MKLETTRMSDAEFEKFIGRDMRIVVVDGGDEVWPKGVRRIGVVIWEGGEFYIRWQDGSAGMYYNKVSEMIACCEGGVSFFYVEIK